MLAGCNNGSDETRRTIAPAASSAPLSTPVPAPCASPEASAKSPPAPRIFSKRRHVWIYPSPSTRSQWIGFLGLGGSVALRDGAAVRGEGCAQFHPVEPRGWVCLDERTTLDPSDREFAAISRFTQRWDAAFPLSYGEAKETPRYWAIPSYAEQKRREWNLDGHLAALNTLRQEVTDAQALPPSLAGVDPKLAGHGPDERWRDVPRVHEYRTNVPAGSTISWIDEFDAEGRTWLVTGDLALVPKDKVAPFARSEFRGLALDDDHKLPLGWVRGKPRPKLRRGADGAFTADGEWPRLTRFGLTGRREQSSGRTYLETTDGGAWIDERHAAVARPSAITPWGDAVIGATADAGRAVRRTRSVPPTTSRATWVEVDVHGGWLIAYEGPEPVYATLVSPGRGRTLRGGDDELVESATPPGVYDVLGKYLASTMAVTSIVHFDVTFAMPFFGTYALHTSYSHDRWGEKKSLGCVNLAPIDARWLFAWAEPSLPEGWHGASFQADTGYRTIVVVH